MPETPSASADLRSARAVLIAADLAPHIVETLRDITLTELVILSNSRVNFLSWLREQGLKIGERQRVANAIGHHLRREAERARAPRLVEPPERTLQFATAADAIAAGEVAFITLTNSGYLSYTSNCLTSLDLVGETRPPLTVYCADSASYEHLATVHAAAHVMPMGEDKLADFLAWKEPGWPRLMWLKCEAMRRALGTHRFAVFTDGDIVYERPGALAFCVDQLLEASHGAPALGFDFALT